MSPTVARLMVKAKGAHIVQLIEPGGQTVKECLRNVSPIIPNPPCEVEPDLM